MRIVAGVAGGRRLRVPETGTRPTTDRVREAMFSAVQSLLGTWSGVHVLDLFAGSGAVGLEALSRGAEHVTFVECDPRAVRVLERNVETVGLPGTSIERADVGAAVERTCASGFDFAFLDPPYDVPDDDVAGLLATLGRRGWLHAGAVVVVERSARGSRAPWPDSDWDPLKHRAYGDTVLWYGRFAGLAT